MLFWIRISRCLVGGLLVQLGNIIGGKTFCQILTVYLLDRFDKSVKEGSTLSEIYRRLQTETADDIVKDILRKGKL